MTTTTGGLTRRQQNLALVTLIVAVVLEIVDLTIVNTALPAIAGDFQARPEAVQWIVAGYALSFSLLLLAGGRLGDAFGYRRMFLWGSPGLRWRRPPVVSRRRRNSLSRRAYYKGQRAR